MNEIPPPTESELELVVTPLPVKREAPVPVQQIIRQTSRRVSPSRATGRPVERHDQRRQPKRGRNRKPPI